MMSSGPYLRQRPKPAPTRDGELEGQTMRIGVVSDTHGYFDPKLSELLAGVEVIVHAGDVDSQNILDELELIAPIHAVRGNVDGADLNLPPSLTLLFEGVQIQVQ